jgi:hypothetical protein
VREYKISFANETVKSSNSRHQKNQRLKHQPAECGISSLLPITAVHSTDLGTNFPSSQKLSVFLPINALSTPKYHLSVKVPEEYNPIQAIESFAPKKATMIEFIPAGESPYEWTGILTLNKFIGIACPVSTYLDHLQKAFKAVNSDSNHKLLKSNIKKNSQYEEGVLAVSYTNADRGLTEVFYSRFFSGPFDLVGIQYTVTLKEGESVDSALSRAETFVNEISVVIP